MNYLTTFPLVSKGRIKAFTVFATLLFLVFQVGAQEYPIIKGYIRDDAGLFSADEKSMLYKRLEALDDSTSNQILIYTTLDLQDRDIAEFAIELGRKNQVGQKENNNGIVLVIKPKTASERGKAFIAVGYGLEGAIPDAIAKRIVEQEMIPSFKAGNYFAGVVKATEVLSKLATGEYKAKDYKKKNSDGAGSGIGVLIILAIFLLIFFSGAKNYGRRNDLPFWMALSLFSSIGNKHRGTFGGHGSGGGGFGGFGGGSFGGGGAGGSW